MQNKVLELMKVRSKLHCVVQVIFRNIYERKPAKVFVIGAKIHTF